MSTKIGREAECAVADYLRARNFTVLEQNWRTRWCEIDIIATKNNVVYFFEAKYRCSASWGEGLDYVTGRKLRQMQFAAEFWLSRQHTALDCRLCAIELTGEPPMVTRVVDCI